jgi:NhaP-type Na+/H+ or K+/H+ antiporter
MANNLVALTLTAIVVSIIAHGISVTPLMERYERVRRRGDRSHLDGA